MTAHAKSVRFELRLTPELCAEIDAWRRRQADLPNRAEAARRLIEWALNPDEEEITGATRRLR